MGRHEIRLRRQKMTSRRIEGHKNFYEVLKQHKKTNRMTRLMRMLVLLLLFLGIILALYFLFSLGTSDEVTKDGNMSNVLNYFLPNYQNYGKA